MSTLTLQYRKTPAVVEDQPITNNACGTQDVNPLHHKTISSPLYIPLNTPSWHKSSLAAAHKFAPPVHFLPNATITQPAFQVCARSLQPNHSSQSDVHHVHPLRNHNSAIIPEISPGKKQTTSMHELHSSHYFLNEDHLFWTDIVPLSANKQNSSPKLNEPDPFYFDTTSIEDVLRTRGLFHHLI
jgi:hypothetical protein